MLPSKGPQVVALAPVAFVACSVLLLLASAKKTALCCEYRYHTGESWGEPWDWHEHVTCDPRQSGWFDSTTKISDDYQNDDTPYGYAVQKCFYTVYGYEGRWFVPYRGIPIGGALCRSCAPGACGDPHVMGFDGSSYLLWGKPNATYDLISERSHHINVRLYHPPGRAARHALYIDAVGILINAARLSVHLRQPAAGSTSASMVLVLHGAGGARDVLTWSGRPIEGAVDARTSYSFRTQAHILVTSQDITLSMVLQENDHLDVTVEEVATYWDDVHGIMGQTYSVAFQVNYNFAKASAVGHLPTGAELAKAEKKRLSLKGSEDDYITSDLLEADDRFSRFVGAPVAAATRKLMSVDDDRNGGNTVQSIAGISASAGTGLQAGRRRSLSQAQDEFKCVRV